MSDALRIIPLGGLGEVGKNMTLYEFDGQRILIDAGLAFPRDEHLGVDLVLPDFSYLEDRPLLSIVLTHGHEDHVGALPYVLREVEAGDVIGTKLTLAMVKSKLDEHGLGATTTLREADPDGDGLQIGPFKLEFVRMAHSIPDCVAIVVETPAGRVLHTGDWKLDHTPVDGLKTDVGKLASLGNRGIDLMLGDSTNAERPGMTGSERLVGEAFRQLIPVRTVPQANSMTSAERPLRSTNAPATTRPTIIGIRARTSPRRTARLPNQTASKAGRANTTRAGVVATSATHHGGVSSPPTG